MVVNWFKPCGLNPGRLVEQEEKASVRGAVAAIVLRSGARIAAAEHAQLCPGEEMQDDLICRWVQIASDSFR